MDDKLSDLAYFVLLSVFELEYFLLKWFCMFHVIEKLIILIHLIGISDAIVFVEISLSSEGIIAVLVS